MDNIAIKKRKKLIVWIISVTLAISIVVGGLAIYVNDYYRADMGAIEAFAYTENINEIKCNGYIAFEPEKAFAGFIFYPGGKVEYTAYIPLMRKLAAMGVFCILIEMPFNLAVLDMNAAEGIPEKYPAVSDWYIGGHSLGGSMAASYLEKNYDNYKGLILLGSYSTSDMTGKDIGVLSIFGSEDNVLNREKYEKHKTNLPSDFTEVKIDGGCHAYFGMYGQQKGDGSPVISAREQIEICADAIYEFINNQSLT